MRVPKPKAIPLYVPDFVRVGFGFALCLIYDGRQYDDFPGRCLECGSSNCVRVGFLKVLFAKLVVVKSGFTNIMVYLQRYHCNRCGAWYTSRGPFYDGALYGAPIVEMTYMLSMEDASYSVERSMLNFGIQIDSDSVLSYNRLLADKAREFASLTDGEGSLYAINLLKILFGVNNAKELGEKLNVDLESLADEAYLRKKGGLKKFVEEIMSSENKRVVHRGLKSKDVVLKDGKASFPDSFTLAMSYIPGAETFSSLICTSQPFNQILADILFKALEGSPLRITDGSQNYNAIPDRINCALHKTRSELKKDPKFRELKKEARELQKKSKKAKTEGEKEELSEARAAKREEMSSYAKSMYVEVVKSTLEKIKQTHPELLDEKGNFNGHLTTNGMEGGNWRIKYAVRVAHARDDSATGKSLLAAIRDSVFSMREGKPRESVANKLGVFSFARIMT